VPDANDRAIAIAQWIGGEQKFAIAETEPSGA
jgi:hypothetical protein